MEEMALEMPVDFRTGDMAATNKCFKAAWKRAGELLLLLKVSRTGHTVSLLC